MPELILTPNKTTFAVGEEIAVRVTLKNTGAAPAIVNRRLALNSKAAPDEFREVRLIVTQQDKVNLRFAARVRIGPPADTDFKELEPEAVVERTYTISRYYHLDKPGHYTLQAIYQNQSDPSGGEAWKGEVESSPITIEIE